MSRRKQSSTSTSNQTVKYSNVVNTSVAARYDMSSPKREFYRVEQSIERNRKESILKYEHERKVLENNLKRRVSDMARKDSMASQSRSISVVSGDSDFHFEPHSHRLSKSSMGSIASPAVVEIIAQLKLVNQIASTIYIESEKESNRLKREEAAIARSRKASKSSGSQDFTQVEETEMEPNLRERKMSSPGPSGIGLPRYEVPTNAPMHLRLIQGIKAIVGIHPLLNSKETKVLMAIMEETKQICKQATCLIEAEQGQERVTQRLHEMMLVLKPRYNDWPLTPEETLGCSYLRLSKENVDRMEEMIRERGMSPGIHNYTDVNNFNLQQKIHQMVEDDPVATRVDSKTTRTPGKIYETKQGFPVAKRLSLEEEEQLKTVQKHKL